MYLPKHFAETRVAVLQDLIRRHPMGSLVVLTAAGLEASHVPFEIDPEPAPHGTLRCHVARANPIWREFSATTPALAIFQGAESYISPSWYPSKTQHGKVVPTWNYVVVHAHGSLRVVDDPRWLRSLVERLTASHEAGRAEPWQVSDAPDDYIQQSLQAIVGLEMPVERLIGKWKLSQNRSAEDRGGVAAGLMEEGTEAAARMAQMVTGGGEK